MTLEQKETLFLSMDERFRGRDWGIHDFLRILTAQEQFETLWQRMASPTSDEEAKIEEWFTLLYELCWGDCNVIADPVIQNALFFLDRTNDLNACREREKRGWALQEECMDDESNREDIEEHIFGAYHVLLKDFSRAMFRCGCLLSLRDAS